MTTTPFNRQELVRNKTVRVCETHRLSAVGKVRLTNYTIASGASAQTLYIPLDPTQNTAVHISHNATDTPTVSGTFTLSDVDDLETGVAWFSVYAGDSTPFAAADERPLIAMKIVANPANGAIVIDVIQTRRKR